MEQLLDFFNPIDLNNIVKKNYDEKSRFANKINSFSTNNKSFEINNSKIAIIGIFNETEDSKNNISSKIREYLYSLFTPFNINIADLGNLKNGNNPNDIVYGIREVLNILHQKKIIAILIGNNNNIPFGSYLAYEEINKPINIVSVENSISLKHKNIESQKVHFIPKIILRKNNSIFNYSLLGFQSYFVSQEELNVISRLYFDTIRLGIVQSNISETEPFFRDSDLTCLNINSIKGATLTENIISPNGLEAREFCQLAKYAGISDRLSNICIYGDYFNNTEIMITAQAIWYFIEGFSQRKIENPHKKSNYIVKFYVEVGKDSAITFYKSKITERWWMDIPYPKSKFEKHLTVSCSYTDYQKACSGNVPDRWWKFFQKIC